MTQDRDDSTLRAAEIAAQLGETSEAQQKQMERAWATCGEALMQTLLDEVKDAEGKMLTTDGKPRTRGGIFFALLRQRVSEDEWFFINHGRARSAPSIALEWSQRLEVIR